MNRLKLSFFAAAALAASLGTASAMPLPTTPSTGESALHDVRVVCDEWGRCYNQYASRSSRHYSSNRHDRDRNHRYSRNDRRYDYSRSVGFGPFGIWYR